MFSGSWPRSNETVTMMWLIINGPKSLTVVIKDVITIKGRSVLNTCSWILIDNDWDSNTRYVTSVQKKIRDDNTKDVMINDQSI